jgi:diamine N-acetyltransferase
MLSMSAEILIQPARRDDLSELADLAARTFSDAFGHAMTPEELKQSLAENRSVGYFERTFESSHILVARREGKIVGYTQFGSVLLSGAPAKPGDTELGRVYVETALQGEGIGRQLVNAALAEPSMVAAPNVFLEVWEDNPRAIALYESLGFEKIGATQFEVAGKQTQNLIMVRRQH